MHAIMSICSEITHTQRSEIHSCLMWLLLVLTEWLWSRSGFFGLGWEIFCCWYNEPLSTEPALQKYSYSEFWSQSSPYWSSQSVKKKNSLIVSSCFAIGDARKDETLKKSFKLNEYLCIFQDVFMKYYAPKLWSWHSNLESMKTIFE